MSSPIKHEIISLGLVGVGTLVVLYLVIKQFTAINAVQWLLLASLLWGYVWWQVWRGLDLNRANTDSPLYSRFGWANRLTILRGGLIAALGGFLFQPQAIGLMSWIPGVLYALAAILDRMDGFVARRSQQTSLLGSDLDTAYDALGLLVAPLLAVGYGKLHWSFLLVSAAYYIFQLGLTWRRARHFPIYPLLPNILRRTLAGFQMGFVAIILLPCFHSSLTIILGIAFMLPMLIGFVVDWLVVSGRIQASPINVNLFNSLAQFSYQLFQPILRVILLVALLVFIFDREHLSSVYWLIIFLFAASMIILGLVARLGAVIIVITLAFVHGENPIDNVTALIIFSSVWLMLLGSGDFSLWQWDDHWVNRRDGEENS